MTRTPPPKEDLSREIAETQARMRAQLREDLKEEPQVEAFALPADPRPQLQVFRLDKRAALPVQMHISDAGWDIRAHQLSETGKPITKTLHQRAATAIDTGLSIRAPEGYYVQICSRSGWALRGVFVANAPGIIDPDYTGELKIILFNGSHETQFVQHGMRIAQLVLAPLVVASLAESERPFEARERGDLGLGSSGTE